MSNLDICLRNFTAVFGSPPLSLPLHTLLWLLVYLLSFTASYHRQVLSTEDSWPKSPINPDKQYISPLIKPEQFILFKDAGKTRTTWPHLLISVTCTREKKMLRALVPDTCLFLSSHHVLPWEQSWHWALWLFVISISPAPRAYEHFQCQPSNEVIIQ